MRNIVVKISVLTLACFSISWLAAAASGINQAGTYPKSLFKTYGAVKFATGRVEAKKTFSGKDVEEILIETTATDVKVERGSSGFVDISLTGHYPTSHEPLETSATPGKLEIRVHEVDVDNGFRFHINFDESEGGLHVRVPENVKRVTVKTISGSVQAEQLSLKDLAVKTTSGDVKVEQVKISELIFQSTSGEFYGKQFEAEKFAGKTVSGDIKLDLDSPAPMMETSSTSGDIELRFRGEPSLKVDFSSVSGEVEVDGEVSGTLTKRGGASFKLGGAKGGLSAKTVSGDLSIKKF